jgi:hypothetical protein
MHRSKMAINRCLTFYYFKAAAVSVIIVITLIIRLLSLCACLFGWLHSPALLVFLISQINPIHANPSYLSKIHFNVFHISVSWSSYWSLSF